VTNDFALVPFARAANSDDPLDSAGHSVLALLQRAASMAEENSQRALSVAHELSVQLRSAEDRIKDLEADVRHYRVQADRAEKWLYQIAQEIEQRFFAPADSRPSQAPIRQAGARDSGRNK
jgi:DNA repair ATPase RecN